MIKAVIFDLDDTLISEREYIKSGFSMVASVLAKENELDEDVVFNKMYELFFESNKNVFNRTLEYFSIIYNMDYIKYLIRIYREHEPSLNFYDDVLETLKDLRSCGYKLGIITDGYKETQLRKIEALNCRKLFDEIIVTDELGREYWKPHKKSYQTMAERLNIDIKEMCYVGDNEEKDFITANKLGVFTICIKRKNGIYYEMNKRKEYLANIKITNLSQIISKIECYNKLMKI